MLRTVATMARPGKIAIQGEIIMYCRPSARIAPHDGVGGDSPSEMKLSSDSTMTRNPRSSKTISGTTCQTLGTM
jgi:hypothetical protein